MNICFLETIIENWDISFIRGKFCYNFFENNEYEFISLNEDFLDEPFSKEYINKFLYKFLFYFKDMDYIIWLNITDWVEILLNHIRNCSQSEKYKFIFHSDFKVIDLSDNKNHSLLFDNIWEQYSDLKDHPYNKSFNKSEILSTIFKSFWWKFKAFSYHDTTLLEELIVSFNEQYGPEEIIIPEKIIIENKWTVYNHFNLLKNCCKATWRIKDLSLWNDSRFIIEKWSFWDLHASYKKDRDLREAHLKHWNIKYDGYFMYVLEDIHFKSPKLAADFLYWNSTWDDSDWVDDNWAPIDVDNYSKYTDSIGTETTTTNNEVNMNIQENNVIPDSNDPLDIAEDSNDSLEIYYLKKWIVDAKWMFLWNGLWDWKSFVILKNSKWDKRITNSFKARNSLMSKRKELKNWKFIYDKNNIILTEDVIFKSPHEASCIIQWTTSWKTTDWFDKNWIPLEYVGWESYVDIQPWESMNENHNEDFVKETDYHKDNSEDNNEILDSYKISFDYASNSNTIDLLKVNCSKMEITFNEWCIIKTDFYYKLQFLKCKELCIKWIPSRELYSDNAKYISLFKWDVLEIWIKWWTFRYDTLRELVKFKWDYLILSWFDLLDDTQPDILVTEFKWSKLWVHWKLTYDQKKFFEDYEWITYSDDEKLAYIEEKEYKDVYDFESDWNYDENDEFNFYSKGVIREDEENWHLKITWDHLTDERAEKYSMYNWNILELNLTHLNNAQVKFISHFKWNILIIGWKESISDDQAKSLSHFKWKEIKLTSVRQLSDRQSAFLSYFKGDKIDLPALDDN